LGSLITSTCVGASGGPGVFVASVGVVLVNIDVNDPTNPPVKRLNPCDGSTPLNARTQYVATAITARQQTVAVIYVITFLFVGTEGSESE